MMESRRGLSLLRCDTSSIEEDKTRGRAVSVYTISWINLGKLVLTHLQVDQVRSLSNLCVGIASE